MILLEFLLVLVLMLVLALWSWLFQAIISRGSTPDSMITVAIGLLERLVKHLNFK